MARLGGLVQRTAPGRTIQTDRDIVELTSSGGKANLFAPRGNAISPVWRIPSTDKGRLHRCRASLWRKTRRRRRNDNFRSLFVQAATKMYLGAESLAATGQKIATSFPTELVQLNFHASCIPGILIPSARAGVLRIKHSDAVTRLVLA